MTAIWWLYLAALTAEFSGLALGASDLRGRARKLAAFSRPPIPRLPAEFNEHPAVAELLASQGLERAMQEQRPVNNELINAVREQMDYSSRVDDELGKLAGLGDRLRRLWIAAGLLVLGAIVGGVANLLAAYEV